MSETNNLSPNKKPNYTLSRAVAGGVLAAAALGAAFGVSKAMEQPKSTEIHQVEEKPADKLFPSDAKLATKILPGEGIKDVILRVYGVDAPEEENQVVENNPEYQYQYDAIVEQNGGNELLQANTIIELPVGFVTEDQLEFERTSLDQR